MKRVLKFPSKGANKSLGPHSVQRADTIFLNCGFPQESAPKRPQMNTNASASLEEGREAGGDSAEHTCGGMYKVGMAPW